MKNTMKQLVAAKQKGQAIAEYAGSLLIATGVVTSVYNYAPKFYNKFYHGVFNLIQQQWGF